MSIAVLASADPALVLGQAGELLAGDPVGHNVVGSKLADAVGYGEPGPYWVGLLDGVPAGVAVQQPAGTPLAVAPMPAELVAAIADAATLATCRCPECSAGPEPPLLYGTIGIVTSSELGLGPGESTPGWAARVTSPRMEAAVRQTTSGRLWPCW